MNIATSTLNSLAGAGGVRHMAARWLLTAELKLLSAAHFGGEQSVDGVDMLVLRDPFTGEAILPGTSLGGALRSHLTDVLQGYFTDEHDHHVAKLFGGRSGDAEGDQSPLIVFEARAEAVSEIRDGVTINDKSGTAEEHFKYDMEVLPAGTTFQVRFELILAPDDDENELLTLLTTAVDGLSDASIAMGMRRSRGLGQLCATNWRAARFNLTNQEGWMQWLLTDHEKPIPEAKPFATAMEAVSAAGAKDVRSLANTEGDKRNRLIVRARLHAENGLLIRSAGVEADAPDAVHLTSGGKPVVSGTSMAGSLRNHALKQSSVVRQRQSDRHAWVDRLFGPDNDAQQKKKALTASKLRVTENFVEPEEVIRVTRIQLDRFTQGVLPGGLFEEEVVCGGTFNLRLELRNPDDAAAGCLLLLLKDLLAGDLTVGGTASVGRGVVKGDASIEWRHKNLVVSSAASATPEQTVLLTEYIAAFNTAELKEVPAC